MLTTQWGACTCTGPHRQSNEDSYLADGRVFAVADGMGGHAAGEVASRIAVEALAGLSGSEPLTPDRLTKAIRAANDDIVRHGFAERRTLGMGTTVTGLALVSADGAEASAVFNVGDSRVYRYAEGLLRQVTVDHSEVEELVAAGYLTRDAARTDDRRHIVTRALGALPAPEVDLWLFAPSAGEQFVVCSDGLSEELTDAQIADVLAAAGDPQDAAERLVDSAIRAGGHDNVTVVVVRQAAAGLGATAVPPPPG
jgi:PPM family protein phosphatase